MAKPFGMSNVYLFAREYTSPATLKCTLITRGIILFSERACQTGHSMAYSAPIRLLCRNRKKKLNYAVPVATHATL